jgi:deoxyhypusine synthase
MSGSALRKNGINRAGNLLIPNENYCLFEDWVMPILDKCLAEQEADSSVSWTPSKVRIMSIQKLNHYFLLQIIGRLGQEINCEASICYWCYANNIPIFCPALTDGSLG